MGEFDENHTELSAEVHLLARMKFQRVVFGAFAIVLISLFALGLSAYREMQHQRAEAISDKRVAEDVTKDAVTERSEIRQNLEQANRLLDETRGALALEKARLAIHEVRAGHADRARELIADSEKMGAPPWLPLASRLTENRAVRFAGSEHADRPVLCGATSGDHDTLGIVRDVGERSLLIEFYDAADGGLIDTTRVSTEVPGGADSPCHLRLDESGRRFFLRLPRQSFAGKRGRGASHKATSDSSPVTDIAATPSLDFVYEVIEGALSVRRRAPGGHYVREDLDLKTEDVRAVAAVGNGFAFAAGSAVYLHEPDGVTELHRFDAAPERVALHFGAGPILAAGLTGDSIELVSLERGADAVISRHDAPSEPVDRLEFLRDDSLVWVGRGGRILIVEFGASRARILGDSVPSFIQRHPQGLVFGNRKGELNVRVNDVSPLLGRSLQAVPPGWSGEPHAHGFVVTGNGGEQFVKLDGHWRSVPAGGRTALTPAGPSWSAHDLRLPDGDRLDGQGVLIGGFSDGGVLLFAGGGKLRYLGPEDMPEMLLPSELAPDAVSVAAEARVAAVRLRDTIYVADFKDEPRALANSMNVAPDLLALDATGRFIAVAYGPTVSVRALAGDERVVRTAAPPREIALLFGGSVLATIEGGELVFYEVALGRELVRVGEDVTAIEATGQAALNIVAGGRLRALDLSPRD